jgi:hypothetical protein
MAETAASIPEYEAVAASLGLFRGLADNPVAGRPEDYARAVLRLLGTPAPTPLRIPIGPGAAEMAAAALNEARDELDAARALMAAVGAESADAAAAGSAADGAGQGSDALAAANGSAS